jgi:alpha-galactosidase
MLNWKIGILIGVLAGAAFTLLSFSNTGQITAMPLQSYASDMQLQAMRSAADFVPDGNSSKTSWRHAKWAEFDNDASGNFHYPEISTRIASVWTETQIYFFFWCRYDSLNVYQGEDAAVERWQLWDRDVAEVFLNPQPERMNHYYEFEVAPNNQWIDLEIDKTKSPFNDAAWNSGFQHATRVDAKNHIWTAEMRIPISSMNVSSIRPGAEWRANFFRAAGRGVDDHRKFLSWSLIPEGKTFHVPARFGILRFVY